ncbi:MAG: diacylglycerol O-acyltransferase / wax synthase [Actinomycetota bacterium]|nr:diacylglycerol O-acyltransferase / wax synthase [Actinomycetota bacterium]
MRLRIDELASLWMETPTAPVQVSLLITLEPVGPDPLTAEGLIGLLAARVEHLPSLHRRIRREGPYHAQWVPDSSPATDRILLDAPDAPDAPNAPGDLADTVPAVWRWAADRAVRPLPADQPPWRVLIARDGRGDGTGGGPALLITAHHALVDGAKGLDLVRSLLGDPSPNTAPSPAPHALPAPAASFPRPGPPWRQRLRARTATAGCVLAALTALRGREPDAGLPRTAGTGRCLDVVHRPLEPVHEIARVLGVTITDVVLAAVASALRDLCATRGSLPPGLVLRASVPIAQPGGGQATGLMVVPLPVGEPDPGRRLAVVASATAPVRARVRRARSAGTSPPRPRSAPGPGAVPGLVPALLRRGLVRSRKWGETRVTAAVTTLRGPAGPWLLPGARVTGIVPIAPLSDRVRVSVTMVSFDNTLTVALHTGEGLDPRRVLGRALGRGLDQMLDTPVEPDTDAGHSARPPHPRRPSP